MTDQTSSLNLPPDQNLPSLPKEDFFSRSPLPPDSSFSVSEPELETPNVFVPSASTPPPPSGIPQISSLPVSPMSSANVMQEIKPKKKSFLPILGGIVGGICILAALFFFGRKLIKKPAVVASKKTTITYWGLFEDPIIFQQTIEEYEKKHPDIKIEYTKMDGLFEYRERLQRRLLEGTGPDIFRIHQSWVPVLGDLLSPIPNSVYDQEIFGKTFYPSAKESLAYNGRYVAVPLMVDGLALYYNEDIFKAAGKSPPATWEELRKTALELTVRDDQGKIRTAGVALGTTGNVDHWSDILGLLLLQNGADLTNPALCTQDDNDPCRGVSAINFYTIFSRSDRVWDNSLPSSTYAFSTGLLAMYFGPSWRAFEIKAKNPSLNFKIIPAPQLPGRNIAWSSYWAEAVSKNSKNAAEAWEFLKYLSSSEVLQQLYQKQSQIRLFGEPYSRVEMASMLTDSPVVGAYIQQAPFAKNWYLSSFTSEGKDGINEQIIKYYEDAVNAINQGQEANNVLSTVTQGVTQVLSRYKVVSVSP